MNFYRKHIFFAIFLLIYFFISITVYKDFSATGDEWTERRAVENLYIYLGQPTTYESITDSRYHDPINYADGHHPLVTKYQRSYQLIQYLLNTKSYYEWDHLINLFFGSIFFIIVYTIFYYQYKSTWKAFIPIIFLALMPRFIGDLPANNKDIPFALMYLASLFCIYLFSVKNVNLYIKIITLGFIFGLTESYRAIGFSIYFVYVGYYIYLSLMNKSGLDRKAIFNFLLELFIIIIFSFFTAILFFPWLGSNFFSNLYYLLLYSKDFQNWDDTIFFGGNFL